MIKAATRSTSANWDYSDPPDAEILRQAEADARVVVTFDLDFSRLVALQRLARPSVLVFRLDEFTTAGLNALLFATLESYQSELDAGAIVTVESARVRVRKLPVW